MHSVEGSRDHGDFVVALYWQGLQVQLALTDEVCGDGDGSEGPDDDEVEADVDQDDGEEKDQGEVDQQLVEALACFLQGDGHGDGDDLRSDDLAEVPAESVLLAVVLDHGLGGGGGRAVAGEASGFDSDGMRHVEVCSGGCFTGAN